MLRLKRVTGQCTSLKSDQDAGSPWNMRMDYNLNLTRVWDAQAARDTSRITHALSAKRGVNVFKKCKVDVTTGYDLARKEMTPTNLNFYVDLHCWELTFNWIPFGVRQSFSLRLNVKSALLRDLKLEARGSDGSFSSDNLEPSSPHQPAVHHHGQAHQKGKKADLVDAVHHAQIDAFFRVSLEEIERI